MPPPLETPDDMAGRPDGQTSQTSQAIQDSNYLSLPNSPTATRRMRRPALSRRQSSTAGPADELSPLLQTARSRIRIHSAHGSPRIPNLSRNQSYTGQFIKKKRDPFTCPTRLLC